MEDDFTARDLVIGMSRQHLGEGALSGAIGYHDGMDFTGFKLEIHTVQYGEVFVRNLGMKASNRKDRSIAHGAGRVGARGLIKNDSCYEKVRIAERYRQARIGSMHGQGIEGL